MIEALIVIALSFGGGWITNWWMTPEKICKEIKYEADPKYYKIDLLLPPVCPEGTGKDGREIECYVDSKLRYVMLPKDWKDLESIIVESGAALKGCMDAKDKYNADKFILR